MNKFIKYLIESIDDEDFFSDLGYDTGKEVTFLVDDSLYPKNVVILGSNPILQDIKIIDHIGAILSKDNDIWLLWNLNDEYWNPFNKDNSVPIDKFGEIVGICVGKGMFAKIGWSGLTIDYSWTNKFMDETNISGSSYDTTMNIINNYSEYIEDTIWEHLEEESTKDYLLYLPDRYELETIWNNVGNWEKFENTNIYKLLSFTTMFYWTSSLYPSSYSGYIRAYNICFRNGSISYDNKTYAYLSVALLHF